MYLYEYLVSCTTTGSFSQRSIFGVSGEDIFFLLMSGDGTANTSLVWTIGFSRSFLGITNWMDTMYVERRINAIGRLRTDHSQIISHFPTQNLIVCFMKSATKCVQR